MKAIANKLFVCLCLAAILLTLIVSAADLYSRFAYENEYDVTYLEDIDSTCVKHLYHGYAVMDCLEGNLIEVTP
jgi:hypothetical protein